MPKVLPEYLELRRQQVLDAAATCFSRKGFHHSTMQDICEQAELSPGAVYRYFHSKEEIIEAMCSKGQFEDAGLIRQMLSQGETLEALDRLIDAFLLDRDDRENRALNIELIAESARNPRILDSICLSRTTIREPLIDYIVNAQKLGEFDPALDADAISRVMTSMYHGLVIQQLAEPNLDIAAYVAVVKSLFHGSFWRGNQPPEEQSAGTSALRH